MDDDDDEEMILFIIQHAKSLFFQDSRLAALIMENNLSAAVNRVEGYVENIVAGYSNEKFRETFRLSRGSFDYILGKIGPQLTGVNTGAGRPPINPEKVFLCALSSLANHTPFRLAGEWFGLSKSSAWKCLFKVSEALLEYNTTADFGSVHWPNTERRQEIKDAFQRNKGIPGIVGAIDGCHIQIPAPKLHPMDYMNRKSEYSIVLQGVCDSDMLFIDCYIGEAGSVHDAKILKRSDLYQRMINCELGLNSNEHIIGDLAYPLMVNLMVGFKDTGNLTQSKVIFNTKLSSKRNVIERAFGLLKGRFRRLREKLEMHLVEKIPTVIFACCILHNICILLNDYMWVEEFVDQMPPAAPYDPANEPVQEVIDNKNRGIAELKRDRLMQRPK